MEYRLELELPGLPKRINQTMGRSWHTKQKEKNHWLLLITEATFTKAPTTTLTKAKLTLTRCSSSCPDYDGLVSSFKHVIDALVSLQIIEDDNMKVIGMPTFLWEPAPPKQGKIKILIEQIS